MNTVRSKPYTVFVAIALSLMTSTAHAAEIEPRAFSSAPVGINFLIAGYAYPGGGLSTVASSPIEDAQLEIDTEIFAYARTLNVWGKSGKLDILLPYSHLSGTAKHAGKHIDMPWFSRYLHDFPIE